MKRQYPNGKIIMLHFPYAHNGFVMSERYPFAISENGLHYGFSYNGRTYCNIYPEGKDTAMWINSFFDASGMPPRVYFI